MLSRLASRRSVLSAIAIAASAGVVSAPAAMASGGTLSVSLTKPTVRTFTANAASLACTTKGGAYDVSAHRTVGQFQINLNDVVSKYTAGESSYASTAHLTVEYLPTGAIATRERNVTVDIGSDGESGSIPFSFTYNGRVQREVAGTVSWQCD